MWGLVQEWVRGRDGGKPKAAPLVPHEEKRPSWVGDGSTRRATGADQQNWAETLGATGAESVLLASLTRRLGKAPIHPAVKAWAIWRQQ